MQEIIDRFFTSVKNKDVSLLNDFFTDDAVYVERNGATYNGITQIKSRFTQLLADGEVRAWDIRRVIDSGLVEWYYEYRFYYSGSISYDGVSIFEVRDGNFCRWSDYIQSVKKTYPLEGKKREELLEMAGAVEYYADWLETLAIHGDSDRMDDAVQKLNDAVQDLAEIASSD